MAIGLIDFDDIDQWERDLAAELHALLPGSIGPAIAAAAPQYVEDALDLLFNERRGQVSHCCIQSIRVISSGPCGHGSHPCGHPWRCRPVAPVRAPA